jgi:hypothetical protein
VWAPAGSLDYMRGRLGRDAHSLLRQGESFYIRDALGPGEPLEQEIALRESGCESEETLC